MLRSCLHARLTDVAANRIALRWLRGYRAAPAAGRGALLAELAEAAGRAGEQGPEPFATPREQFFKRLHGLPGGLPFLWELRADLLAWRDRMPGLRELDASLAGLLSAWFEARGLELRAAAHAGGCRYVFFHPALPDTSLLQADVAFCAEMPGSAEEWPRPDTRAAWAVFHSIETAGAGLRGVSLGNFLMRRMMEDVRARRPDIRHFSALAPLAGLRGWLRRQKREAAVEVREQALPLAARYLLARDGPRLLDGMARFHLGNGARIERLNWRADGSPEALARSCGIMANYLYDPERLDANLEALAQGRPAMSTGVARLLESIWIEHT